MKRSHIYISVIVMITASVIGSGCKKNRSSQKENSSISQNSLGQQGSSSTNPTGNTPGGSVVGTTGGSSSTSGTSGATGNGEVSKDAATNGVAGNTQTSGNTSLSTGTGTTTVPTVSTGTTTQIALAPDAPKEPVITCFTESFKHKPTAGHDSEEACSHHKNLLKLSHSDINMKSVCVRVNDVPVKFDRIGHGDEFVIGSIAGPQSVITVKYCTGKNTCADAKKDDCVIPKDEFLDAIGGGDSDGAVAQWENTDNAADKKLNNDVKRELADIDETATDNHGANASVFKDWVAEKPAPACGFKKHPS